MSESFPELSHSVQKARVRFVRQWHPSQVPDFAEDRPVSTPLNTSFDWDVFLSHSSADKPRITRLAERLTTAGFLVWFDHPAIDSGEDIVTAIEKGLERSRVLVLCMTKATFREPLDRDHFYFFPTVKS